MSLSGYLKDFGEGFEPRLRAALSRRTHLYTPALAEAVEYTPLAGGKRLRPVVLQLWADAGMSNKTKAQEVLDAGVAIELVHASSLVLDDLPSMDDATLRRGKPTCHRAYGVDTAILAAQAQLVLAFELLGELDSWRSGLEATAMVARAVGMGGMVGGQHVDLHLDDGARDVEALEYIHRLKTGMLFETAARLGVRLGGGGDDLESLATTYARNLGLAFQIKDDLLDVLGTVEEMGKDTGKDTTHANFVQVFGVSESEEIMYRLLDTAREVIAPLEKSGALLAEICDYVGKRTR